MVSSMSIIGILFTLVIAIIVPIAALIFIKIKFKSSLAVAAVGAGGFIAFALILEKLLHMVVIPTIASNAGLYIVYACLASGVFEETSRLVGFKLLEKSKVSLGVNNALAYGIGHGGIEAILLVGTVYFNNLVLALGINSIGVEKLAAEAGANSAAITRAANQFLAAPAGLFYLAGFERILAMILHIGLTLLMWLCVTKRGSKLLYPICILLHALANSGAAMLQVGVGIPVVLVYVILIIAIALIYGMFFLLYKKSMAVLNK